MNEPHLQIENICLWSQHQLWECGQACCVLSSCASTGLTGLWLITDKLGVQATPSSHFVVKKAVPGQQNLWSVISRFCLATDRHAEHQRQSFTCDQQLLLLNCAHFDFIVGFIISDATQALQATIRYEKQMQVFIFIQRNSLFWVKLWQRGM